MKLLLKLALCLSAVSVAWGQCGSGHFGLVAGQYWGCIPSTGAGNGTVTSIGLAGTANQITITGSTPITGAGSWTLSLPSTLLFPGTIQVTGLTTLAASTTGAASLNIPSGSAPTVPNSGDFWNQSGVLNFYDGSATQALVYQSRQVSTSAPLSGGSALSANMTLSCPTCTTSAASLTNNNLLIGNSGQGMAALGSVGTTTTLLHGNAAGPPTFGNVADGDFGANLLGVPHGGTNLASGTSGGILAFTGATTLASSGALTANMPVIGGGAGVVPSVGTVTGNTTQFATSTGTQTSTAAVKIDASGNHIASGVTIDASNNVVTPGSVTTGSGGAQTGYMSLQGATSGAQGFSVSNVAGTSTLYLIPAATGSGNFLKDTGSATCPTLPAGAPSACEQLAWAAPVGSGTVNSAAIGQLYYNSTGTAVANGNANLTVSGSALTIGVAGSAQGSVLLAGSTSGSTTLAAPVSGGGTMTFQAGSDTVIGRATTDTLTNKTYDTAGTGNVFKVNGTQLSAVKGNTATVQLESGALTNGNLLSADANGNAVDSTVVAANAVTATGAAAAAKQICTASGASKTCSYIDFPSVYAIPAANCNNATAGAGMSLPTSGAPTVTCRTGTNVQTGYLAFAASQSAQFQLEIPADWDSATNPYIRVNYTQTGTTASQTIAYQVQIGCSATTDDPSFSTAQTFTTTTTVATANTPYSQTLQLNSTSMTNCTGGNIMNVKISTTAGSNGASGLQYATLTFPRLIVVQAN